MLSDTSSLIDQLLYLVDELGAQRPFFERISESILSERPPDGPSIRDLYDEMLIREQRFSISVIEYSTRARSTGSESPIQSDPEAEIATIDELLSGIMAARSENVAAMPDPDSNDWNKDIIVDGNSATLLERAYHLALSDADTLRAISTQLSEIRMLFRQ